ncbi:MAG TPA: hypothetical protein VFL42_10505 [Terriglobales bacterium]|nr:hypothetical protein [Terriglobales bacterium]
MSCRQIAVQSRIVVLRCLVFCSVLNLVSPALPLPAADTHLQESGCAALLARSSFAHGYRHGYEQGFHQGNIDANMARPPKNVAARFKGMPSGYEARFGAKKSFEQGFTLGIKAGYNDGYAGHAFRAVAGLGRASGGLDKQTPPQDPENVRFDNGVAAGYRDGLDRAASGQGEPQLELEGVRCPQSSAAAEKVGEEFYCQGYRRGYLLGNADGVASFPQRKSPEANQ